MENEKFNLSLRKYLKRVGVTSQQEVERLVREGSVPAGTTLRLRMVLTAEGTDLKHVVEDDIET
jgi:16S rRNA U516 pseudouridylate synthase RsuA-like enzyme